MRDKANIDWSALPKPALIKVFEYFSPHEALHDHAMVCRNWAEAAAAATTRINLCRPCPDMDSVQRFLHSHGANVISFKLIEAGGPQLSSLPCPGLQELILVGCRLNQDPDSSVCSDLAAATKLTRVTIGAVEVQKGTGDLYAAVSRLTNLQDLGLVCVTGPLAEGQSPKDRLKAVHIHAMLNSGGALRVPSTVLQHLQHLTVLRLVEGILPSSMQHLSTLTKLEYIDMQDHFNGLKAASLSGLQALQAVTYLKLAGLGGEELSSSTAPWLGKLTSLQGLELAGRDVEDGIVRLQLQPSVLKGPAQLHTITLEGMHVLGGAAGVAELLAVLAQQQQLTQLKLADLEVFNGAACPASAYSALTASSDLEHLSLQLAGHVTTIQPIWQHVFPEGRQLEYLTYLKLSQPDKEAEAAAISGMDVQRIVQCCPDLEELDLVGVILQQDFVDDDDDDAEAEGGAPGNVDITPLLEPPGLTRLAVAGVTDMMSTSALAHLTGLEKLGIYHWSVSKTGLLALTNLKALASLRFLGGSLNVTALMLVLPHFLKPEEGGWVMRSKAPPGSPGPDLWQQLADILGRFPDSDDEEVAEPAP